jgi:hypothetical protein
MPAGLVNRDGVGTENGTTWAQPRSLLGSMIFLQFRDNTTIFDATTMILEVKKCVGLYI